MQFLTSLFGGSENTFVTAILALGIVLVLIVLGLWVLKVFFRASNTLARGRNRRLNVVDSVMIDPKRQLFIVRRDNVEHLILTGGPQDLVVESGIPVERPSGGPARRAPGDSPLPAAVPAGEEHPGNTSQPVTEALQAARSLAPTGPMERLREMARLNSKRSGGSLRHTGLMRPVSRMEPAAVIPINPDNSDHRRVDSAKTGPARDTSGQTRIGGDHYPADGAKAEGG